MPEPEPELVRGLGPEQALKRLLGERRRLQLGREPPEPVPVPILVQVRREREREPVLRWQ